MTNLESLRAAAERRSQHKTGEVLQPVRDRCADEAALADFGEKVLAGMPEGKDLPEILKQLEGK